MTKHLQQRKDNPDMWYINGRVESLPLTNMRYINGWVESLVLRRKAGDFFHISIERMERMKKTGFYIIKDRFFEDMLDPCGVKFMPTQPDVLSILEQLKQKK